MRVTQAMHLLSESHAIDLWTRVNPFFHQRIHTLHSHTHTHTHTHIHIHIHTHDTGHALTL